MELEFCLVTKKNGSVRFCTDYRILNSLIKKYAYALLAWTPWPDANGTVGWTCIQDFGKWVCQMKVMGAQPFQQV